MASFVRSQLAMARRAYSIEKTITHSSIIATDLPQVDRNSVLYEDTSIIAYMKAAGLTVTPGRYEKAEDCLHHQLQAAIGAKLWAIHRLDRGTSGIVLFAKNERAHRKLSRDFEKQKVEKTYLAFVRGLPNPEEQTIEIALHSARKGQMRPAKDGESGAQKASSMLKTTHVAETKIGNVAMVHIQPLSGRQHQLRVHLRAIGNPLLVDPIYSRVGDLKSGDLGLGSPALARLTLHAFRLCFSHPETGVEKTINAPLPSDLFALEKWLKRDEKLISK
jgi:RluA family pseudouridine synthase